MFNMYRLLGTKDCPVGLHFTELSKNLPLAQLHYIDIKQYFGISSAT